MLRSTNNVIGSLKEILSRLAKNKKKKNRKDKLMPRESKKNMAKRTKTLTV